MLISWQRRWFLVSRDVPTATWTPYRADWVEPPLVRGRRFAPAPLPGDDYVDFVLREVARSGWSVHARITVDASAEGVLATINPTVGVVEPIDAGRCTLVTGADSVEILAVYIGMLGMDFHVTEPPQLLEAVEALARRYAGALPGGRLSGR